MAKFLVVVESPAKAKTINKYLGKNYRVMASIGHVKDLPKEEREEYYTRIPDTPWLAIRYAYFCNYCRAIWDEQRKKIDSKKIKLGS